MTRKAKPAPTQKETAEKESKIKELVSQLEGSGYQVRREKLKQGPGWKVLSGLCRVEESKIIFVDRKNTLEDQILFLTGCLSRIEEGRKETVTPG